MAGLEFRTDLNIMEVCVVSNIVGWTDGGSFGFFFAGLHYL
jgi:hypothetical protein